MMPPREPIVLPWWTFHSRQVVEGGAFGVMVFGPPEWALHVYLGWWLIGIERVPREEN